MTNIYETLQDKFIEIRYLHGEGCFDEIRFLSVKSDIKQIYKELKNETNKDNKLLIDCIDNLFRFFDENNRQKFLILRT